MSAFVLDFSINTDTLNTDEPITCKGLIYRGHVSVYQTNNGGMAIKKWVTPLVKKSCKGCDYCIPIADQFVEFLGDKDYTFGLDDIEDDCLYELRVTNESKDWETGYIDSWDLEFIKIIEGEK